MEASLPGLLSGCPLRGDSIKSRIEGRGYKVYTIAELHEQFLVNCVEWADGRGQMADGRWQVAGGRWQMANGKRQMADGKWQMANGRWQMADGNLYEKN